MPSKKSSAFKGLKRRHWAVFWIGLSLFMPWSTGPGLALGILWPLQFIQNAPSPYNLISFGFYLPPLLAFGGMFVDRKKLSEDGVVPRQSLILYRLASTFGIAILIFFLHAGAPASGWGMYSSLAGYLALFIFKSKRK